MPRCAWLERAITPGTEKKPELYAYLPDNTHGYSKYWLKKHLGSRIKAEPVLHHGVIAWKLAAHHLMPLAYAMFMGGGNQFPAESRSLARQHLKEIHRVVGDTLKNEEVKLDELSRAHLEEINDQLQKVLDAKFESGGV